MSEFELLGHDNPLGRYPAPVVPVGRLNGSVVVVYATTGNEQEVVVVDPDVEYVRHDVATKDKLASFEYSRDRLFALGETNIRKYSINDERRFFAKLLKEPGIKHQDPLLRLSLAKGAKAKRVVQKEIVECLNHLNSEKDAATTAFVDAWYQAQRKSLVDRSYMRRAALPADWRTLIEKKSSWIERVLANFNFKATLWAVAAVALIGVAAFELFSSPVPSPPAETFSLIAMIQSMGQVALAVVVILLVMSVYSIAIMVERYLTYTAAKEQSREFASRVTQALRHDRIDEAINISNQHRKSHLAMVVSSGLQEFRAHEQSTEVSRDEVESSRRALERAIAIKSAEFKRGLDGLATVGSLAPFVGLFGTVFGIIRAFRNMGDAGNIGIGAVASGISEALFTTALGLLVAVPAVWVFNYFTGKVDGFIVEMENAADEIEGYVKQHEADKSTQKA